MMTIYILCHAVSHGDVRNLTSGVAQLSQRETALQGGLTMAKSGRLERGDNNLQTLRGLHIYL